MNQLLRILRRNWLLIAVPAVVAAAVAYPLARGAQYFEAQSLLTLMPNSPDGESVVGTTTTSSVDVDDYVSQQLPVFTSPPTLKRASQLSGVPADRIASDVGVEAQTAGNLVIVARADAAGVAVREANGLGRAYLESAARTKAADLRAAAKSISDQLDRVQKNIDQLSGSSPAAGADASVQARRQALATQYSELLNRRDDALALATLQRGDGRVVQPAVAASPGRSIPSLVLLGALLGLILGVVAALVRDQLLNRIDSREDVEALSHGFAARTPVLGEVPKLPRRHRRRPSDHPLGAESLQTIWLRSQIEAGDGARTIVVTSAEQRAGKTLIATGLAAVGAGSGSRVVLVSADFWHPDAESLFGIDQRRHGLSDWIAARARGEDPGDLETLLIDASSEGVPGLRILPAGTVATARSAVLSPDGLAAALDHLKAAADVVLLDSPPVLAIPYALVIAKSADAAILTVSAGSSTRPGVQRALASLHDAAPTVGVVINRSPDVESYGIDVGHAVERPGEPVQA